MKKKGKEFITTNNKIIMKKILRYLLAVVCGFIAGWLAFVLLNIIMPPYQTIGCSSEPGRACLMIDRIYMGAEEYFLSHTLPAIILGIITFVAIIPKQTKITKIIWWGLVFCMLIFYCFLWTDMSYLYNIPYFTTYLRNHGYLLGNW